MENKFSKKIKADRDIQHMSCPEDVAIHIANHLKNFRTAAELCSGVGGLVIHLACNMDKVYAIDNNPARTEYARYNARLYKVADRIQFITGNALDEKLLKSIKADVVVLDPDWRAKSNTYDFRDQPFPTDPDQTCPSTKKLFGLAKKYISPNIVIRAPKTFTTETLQQLGLCRIENILRNNTLSFKIAYYLEDIKGNTEEDIRFN